MIECTVLQNVYCIAYVNVRRALRCASAGMSSHKSGDDAREMMRMMWPWAGGALNRKWVVGGCESGARCLSSVTRSTLIHCSFELLLLTSSATMNIQYNLQLESTQHVATATHHSRLPTHGCCTTILSVLYKTFAEIDLADRTCLFGCSFVVLVIAPANSLSA